MSLKTQDSYLFPFKNC